MTDTPRMGLSYPVDANPADVPTWMRDLALDLDPQCAIDLQGAIGSRPAAGVQGRYFTSTNEGAGVTTYRDDGTAWRKFNYIPRVTGALPASPPDGDEVLWQYDATLNPAVAWHMRFNKTVGVWEYVGGPPVWMGTPTGFVASGSPTVWNVGPTPPALPCAGAWRVSWGALVRNVGLLTPNSVQRVDVGPMLNGNQGGVLTASEEWVVGPAVSAYVLVNASLAGSQVFTNVAKNDVLSLGAKVALAGYQVSIEQRFIEFHPMRITP